MNVKKIRTWLLGTPQPSAIRVKSANAEVRTLEVPENVTWSALAESIVALDPVMLEALDPDEKVLRIKDPREDEDEDARPARSEMPAIKVPEGDAETQRLVVFGQLLAQAYRHSTDVAFERMVALFEACNRRSETLERSLDSMVRLLNRAVREQYDAASTALANVPEEQGGIGSLISAFLQGQAKAEVEKAIAQTTAANGAAAKEV